MEHAHGKKRPHGVRIGESAGLVYAWSSKEGHGREGRRFVEREERLDFLGWREKGFDFLGWREREIDGMVLCLGIGFHGGALEKEACGEEGRQEDNFI